jgi:hypothetical protein
LAYKLTSPLDLRKSQLILSLVISDAIRYLLFMAAEPKPLPTKIKVLQTLLAKSRIRCEIYRRGLERVIAHDDVNGTMTGHSDIAARALANGRRDRKVKV